MSRMPKLDMSINEIPEETQGLNESEYLKRPAEKPSSIKPKKKRVMSEKQLANLARARKISAEKRKAKKEAQTKEKVGVKGEDVPLQENVVIKEEDGGEISYPKEVGQHTQPSAPIPIPVKSQKPKMNGWETEDYLSSVVDKVYGRLMTDRDSRMKHRKEQEAEQEEIRLYEESIREDERKRIGEKVKAKAPSMGNHPLFNSSGQDWDKCFQPRGGGGW